MKFLVTKISPEAINDDFEALIFAGHTLANNILGTRESVSGFTKKDIVDFINANYHTHEIIFAVSGDYNFAKLIKLSEKYFGIIPENAPIKVRTPVLTIPIKKIIYI